MTDSGGLDLPVYVKQRIEPPAKLLQLAQEQCGVVSRAQCKDLGLGDTVLRRLLADGWSREANGIYRVTPTQDQWLTSAWTGVLLGRQWAMLGGWSAAHVLGLTTKRPEPIEIWVREAERCTVVDGRWRFRRDLIKRRSRGSLPATRVEQTIADCAATATPHELASLVGKAVSDRLTTVSRIAELVEEHPRLPGRKALLALLPDVAAGAFSALEVQYLRAVERAHGLPAGQRQFRLNGKWLDVAHEEFAVVVELDGRLGHLDEGRFRDMDRDNRHAAQGIITLRFGWNDVLTRPCEVARQVAEVLSTRGWAGVPDRCRQCPKP